ncbi:carboxypeptidase-like regulatory domain-containing protein [Hymenobacter profundi]|uniref:Carboxypeptidase-like regulatory domain-containing protein n=1 Tax=Hymenobacter profundi TaxID=1982110 RepID=A0ABS6X0V8_9BACT|nr:carboxypeptidase-like regulatory domain-containing protein [Hymenobacter profundi]
MNSHTQQGFAGVILLFRQDSTIVSGVHTDSSGRFHLSDIPVGRYQLEVQHVGYRSKWLDLTVAPSTLDDLSILFPEPCPYQYSSGQRPICVGGYTDQLIPIKYGPPSKQLLAKARQKKVYLAGCEVTGCDPRYYCSQHKKQL